MDAKERLYSAATQEFDKCIEKYVQKIKNCLWNMICHAYNEGIKDGEQKKKNTYNCGHRDGAINMLDVFRSIMLNPDEYIYSFSKKDIRDQFNTDDPRIIVMHYEAQDILNKAEEIINKTDKENNIQIGDEVCWMNSTTGKLEKNNSFIVTEYEKGSHIGGITFDGSTHFHDSDAEELWNWKKTGRHYNILDLLKQVGEDDA